MMLRKDPGTVMEAIETLNAIADLEDLGEDMTLMVVDVDDLEVSERQRQTIEWLQEHDGEHATLLVKRLFGIVLSYLKQVYRDREGAPGWEATLDKIKSIMALVAEAAQKLERFMRIFYGAHEGAITSMQEYVDLQNFYLKHLLELVESKGSREAMELFMKPREKPRGHVGRVEDLQGFERITRDLDYELFYLKREDGQSFATPALEDTVKLACDLGSKGYTGEDPFIQVPVWLDDMLQKKAEAMWTGARPLLDQFYNEPRQGDETELAVQLDYALMSLILAGDPDNHLLVGKRKCCSDYFLDFQDFLRRAVHSREYQHVVAHPEEKGHHRLNFLKKLIEELCRQLYLQGNWAHMVIDLVEKTTGEPVQGPLSKRLRYTFGKLSEMLKAHPNGPLFKVLDLMRKESRPPFDLMMEQNVPHRILTWVMGENTGRLLRLPSPTWQDQIDHVEVHDEYKAFQRTGHRHLLINLQDRASWKENARAVALEHVENTISFGVDTDFYHGMVASKDAIPVDEFMKILCEEVESDTGGYWIPQKIFVEIKPQLGPICRAIQRLFFPSVKILSKSDRQAFIDLFHFLLSLRLLDHMRCESFSFTCKDGVDLSMVQSAMWFVGTRLLTAKSFSDEDFVALDAMLFSPALLYRERMINPVRFERCMRMVEVMEQATRKMSVDKWLHLIDEELSPYFSADLKSLIVSPLEQRGLLTRP